MAKWLDFLLKDVGVLGTNSRFAKLELLLLEKGISPPLLFSVLYESRQMQGMHIDSCDTCSVEEHPCQGCWNPASKSNNVEADLTTLKRKGLFLVSSPIFAISCWKLEGTISILRNLSGDKIPNLPCNGDSLVNVQQ